MKKHSRECTIATCLALLLVMLAIFAPAFFAPQPMLSRLAELAPAAVVTVGMAVVILSRQIDISAGSIFGVCGIAAGQIALLGAPFPLVFCGAIVTGALLGALNGALVAGLGLPSIVVTLATMVVWRDGLRLFQKGRYIDLPQGSQWFGLSQTAGQIVLIVMSLALIIAGAWALKHLSGGRRIYAVGSDAEAARLAGLNPRAVTFAVFVILGVLAGLASGMNLVRSPQVDPKAGMGMELRTIAAAVVGGVAISGGKGSLWGAFLGLILLGTINPALTYFHVESYWERAIQGTVILLAVAGEGLRQRRNEP